MDFVQAFQSRALDVIESVNYMYLSHSKAVTTFR